jgi:hypothetical protein
MTVDQFVEVKANLKVTPFNKFRSELFPQKVKKWTNGTSKVYNQGNNPSGLAWIANRGNELNFQPPKQITNPGGQAAIMEFRPSTKLKRWFGSAQSLPFYCR